MITVLNCVIATPIRFNFWTKIFHLNFLVEYWLTLWWLAQNTPSLSIRVSVAARKGPRLICWLLFSKRQSLYDHAFQPIAPTQSLLAEGWGVRGDARQICVTSLVRSGEKDEDPTWDASRTM